MQFPLMHGIRMKVGVMQGITLGGHDDDVFSLGPLAFFAALVAQNALLLQETQRPNEQFGCDFDFLTEVLFFHPLLLR